MTVANPVRYAVIGCGSVGPVHADAARKLENVELVAVCDVIPERARGAAERFDAAAYTNCEALLEAEAPEAVSICTPHHTHAELTVTCLRRGAHVLCEKPLALSHEDMDRMVETAAAEGRLLGGVFQHRFDPVAAAVKRATEQGLFGQALNAGAYIRCYRGEDYYASGDWRGTWAGEGGAVLINQAIHSIDVMHWLAGPVKSVFGRHTNLQLGDAIEAEDTACAFLEFESGAIGTIEATSSSHMDFAAGVHFYGTHGSLRLNTGGTDELEFLEMADPGERERFERMIEAEAREESETVGKHCYGVSHRRQIADFAEAVRTGGRPLVTGEDARHAVEIVLAVYESAEQGRAVDL
ncbi:MAG: Gfo/Idh/MocA family protein [Planctomycetota bacterium]